jgi:hypothetical protein
MTRHRRIATLLIAVMVGVALPSCIKPSTFNPAAAPDNAELDRLQKTINDRPDLEVAQRQLTDLDAQSRAVIAKYAPQTVIPPSTPKSDHGCVDPFTHNIGDTYTIEKIYARPAPSDQQWQQITEALRPILDSAKFRPNVPPNTAQTPGTLSVIRDDGATIDLINSPGAVLAYSYSTGCRLPAVWRTAPPPPDQRPTNDSGVHYPYLYGSPGGRTASAS